MRELAEGFEVRQASLSPLRIAGTKRWADDLLDERCLAVGRRAESAEMPRSDSELRQPAAGEGDLRVQLAITLLAGLGPRCQQSELFEDEDELATEADRKKDYAVFPFPLLQKKCASDSLRSA